MFDSMIYWLGSKGCYAVGIIQEVFMSESICSRNQTWNMGLVLVGAAALFLAYIALRRRS